MAREWTLTAGKEPIPGIGPGPLSEAEYKARVEALVANEVDPKAAAKAFETSGVYTRVGATTEED